jgi:hypothetical protein
MRRLLLMTALAAAAISLPAAATGSPTATLTGVVGPGFNISLKNADGTAVKHLDAGAYTVSVSDQSDLHNFHLFGPGVDQMTPVEGMGTASWDIQVTDGTYSFVCDAHPTQMKGSFTAGAVQPPPPPPPTLNGKVTAKTISLTSSLGKVKRLVEGTYKVAVNDTAKTQNFHLSGPGVNRKTGVKSKSKAKWTVALTPGKYTYRSDKSRTLRRSFTVTAKPS